MNKWIIVMIALAAMVFAVPASAEDVTSNGASVSVTSIAIRAGDGGSLPTSILVGETFMVLITEDDSPVGAGTNVIFTLPSGTGDPVIVPTGDDGKAPYTPLITGTLGIRVLDGIVTVAEELVNVVTTPGGIPTLGSITISPDSADLLIGDTEPFTAICYDTSGNPMSTGYALEWACDTDAVGTIDSSGLFTAEGVGTATVTVTATYEGVTKTDTAIVNVSALTETVPVAGNNFTEEIDAGTAADVTVDGTFDHDVTGSIDLTPVADPEETVGSYAFTGNDEALMGLTVTPDAAVIAELADGDVTIRIEMCYNATELASKNIDSSTLAIWRFDGTDWVEMVAGTPPCVANGITGTCAWIEVNNLSTFALVGTKTAAPAPSGGGGGGGTYPTDTISAADTDGDGVPDVWDVDNSTPSGYWVNSDGIGRRWGDMNGDGELTSVDALMILQAAAGKIGL